MIELHAKHALRLTNPEKLDIMDLRDRIVRLLGPEDSLSGDARSLILVALTSAYSAGQGDYRESVLAKCPHFNTDAFEEKLSLSGLGIAGEGGEVADIIKKVLHHKKPLDKDKLILEMGDVRWYLEYLAVTLGVTMKEVEARNVEKNEKRYPNGFSPEAANAHRE